MRCIGRNNTGIRCSRETSGFFCETHKRQWITWVVSAIGFVGGIIGIYQSIDFKRIDNLAKDSISDEKFLSLKLSDKIDYCISDSYYSINFNEFCNRNNKDLIFLANYNKTSIFDDVKAQVVIQEISNINNSTNVSPNIEKISTFFANTKYDLFQTNTSYSECDRFVSQIERLYMYIVSVRYSLAKFSHYIQNFNFGNLPDDYEIEVSDDFSDHISFALNFKFDVFLSNIVAGNGEEPKQDINELLVNGYNNFLAGGILDQQFKSDYQHSYNILNYYMSGWDSKRIELYESGILFDFYFDFISSNNYKDVLRKYGLDERHQCHVDREIDIQYKNSDQSIIFGTANYLYGFLIRRDIDGTLPIIKSLKKLQ